MRVAGAQSDVFTKSAVRGLYKRSRGIPRLINVIADRALLAAYTQDRRSVDGELVKRAAAEVFGARFARRRWWPIAAGVAGLVLFALATTNLWRAAEEPAVAAAAVGAVPPEPVLTPTVATGPAASSEASLAALPAATATPALGAATDPSPAAAVSLDGLLGDPEFAVSTDEAIGELLGLWGARYDAARGEPCRQAEQQGLRCLFQDRGTLGELRRVNWPTIVSLVAEDGTAHSVVIASLDHEHAAVVARGKTFELPLVDLSFYWYGDHLLLWRPGGAPSGDLAPGDDAVGVLWLRNTLAQINGEQSRDDGSTLYDAALERRVRAYQRERQLTVDGIVGERTQVALLADLKMPNTPLLLAGR
jgi:general secretion pathway protein A